MTGPTLPSAFALHVPCGPSFAASKRQPMLLPRFNSSLTPAGRLCAVSLCLLLLSPSLRAVPAERTGDDFLAGYIAAVLERDLHWERGSYTLKVAQGVATITLLRDDPLQIEAAESQLRFIDGLQGLTILVEPLETGKPASQSQSTTAPRRTEAFPTGDVFRPLIADPKQPRFFISAGRFASVGVTYTMAPVGFGETFGLYRLAGGRERDGLQLSVEGALFAQFNLSAPSYDLVNADYTIGIPVTYRHGDNSLRFRVYHQSSHLGDELLLGANPPGRVNLSYEALELLYSHEWPRWRIYGGGEYLFHKEPRDLEAWSAHWGVEYRGSRALLWNGRPLGGVDMKSLEEHDWLIDISVKAGLEFGHPDPGHRRLRLMAEWYKGFDPHGQFYVNKVEYYGVELSLGF